LFDKPEGAIQQAAHGSPRYSAAEYMAIFDQQAGVNKSPRLEGSGGIVQPYVDESVKGATKNHLQEIADVRVL